MEVQITALSRRGTALMRRSWRISARRVRFGRGTSNEVPLSDIRVDLTAAALFTLASGTTMVEAFGPTPVRVNGVSAKAAPVKPGDEITIGPYQVRLEPPPAGFDIALSFELVQPLGNSLEQLRARSRIGLDQAGLSKRRAAWVGVLLIVAVGLAGPIAVLATSAVKQRLGQMGVRLTPATLIALLWKPGEMSNAHRFFAGNCTTCHERPFARVADQACLACHGQVGNHVPAGLQLGGRQETLEATRCTACHEEHRGSRAMVISDMRLCLNCHRTLAETTPNAGVRDVTGFPSGHPQYRATVVADAAGRKFERAAVDRNPAPRYRPGIKFSHAAHLVPQGFPALGIKPMACADCHVAEPSGQGFAPITYKQQCVACHGLEFARQELPWPDGRVPHGEDAGIAAAVWNFYAGKALQGGMIDRPAAVLRQIPGAPLPAKAAGAEGGAQRWVAEKTEAALRTVVLDDNRGCAYCHYGTGPNGAMRLPDLMATTAGPPDQPPGRIVAPVLFRTRFLPHARFDHAKHIALDCEHCHAARKAETLDTLLIPGIETCAECHGSESAALHAQSTCTTCHRFHDTSFGPMREAAAQRAGASPTVSDSTASSADRSRRSAGF